GCTAPNRTFHLLELFQLEHQAVCFDLPGLLRRVNAGSIPFVFLRDLGTRANRLGHVSSRLWFSPNVQETMRERMPRKMYFCMYFSPLVKVSDGLRTVVHAKLLIQ